jgi:acetate kinase
VRSAICNACAWLCDDKLDISTSNSRVAAYVIKTDGNLMIARHARALVGN